MTQCHDERRTARRWAGRCISALVVTALVLPVLATESVASAAPSGTTRPIPGSRGGTGVTVLCADSGFSCTGGGYNGSAGQIGGLGWATWQYWNHGSAAGDRRHNCTTYAAFRLQQNGYPYPGWTGNATDWDNKAWAQPNRPAIDLTPAVGAIAQWNAGYGHVAYVEEVSADAIVVTSDNWGGGTNRLRIMRSSPYWPDNFIHFRDVAPPPTDPGPGPVAVSNGNFESGTNPWKVTHNPGGVVNRSVYAVAGRARSGVGFMEANTSVPGGSVGQDTGIAPAAGRYYTLRAWVKDAHGGPDAATFSVTAALWALGGSPEVATTDVVVGSRWTPVDVVLRVNNGGHSQFRIEFYMNTVGRNLNVDDVSLTSSSSDPGLTTASPIGWVDHVASTAPGTVTVSGWTLDPTVPLAPTSVHVYVGGAAGTPGAQAFDIGTAATDRPDVEVAHPHAGRRHGFATTVRTTLTGSVPVCVYAINIGQGANAGLGGNCRSVTIVSAVVPPAPRIAHVVERRRRLAVWFDASAPPNGSAISSFQISADGGATWRDGVVRKNGSIVIRQLARRTTYAVSLRSVNAAGPGSQSPVVNATTR